MNDFEEVYSLLLTGVVVLFLFLTLEEVVNNFEQNRRGLLVKNQLLIEGLNHSRVLKTHELSNAYYLNLENNESTGVLKGSVTSGLPYLEFDNGYEIGVVITSE